MKIKRYRNGHEKLVNGKVTLATYYKDSNYIAVHGWFSKRRAELINEYLALWGVPSMSRKDLLGKPNVRLNLY